MAPNDIVEFPRSEIAPASSDEERAARITREVERLTRLAPNEWLIWYKGSAQRLGTTPELMRLLVEAKLKDIKATEHKAETEQRRHDDRIERQRRSAERDEARKREKTEREEARKQEKDQRQVEKDAERKAKEKGKAFSDIAKLPSDRSELKLAELASRLGEDLAVLREEFTEYTETADETEKPSATWYVESWSEPVATAALLRDIINKIDQHFAARPHEVLTIALWTMMAWVHEVAATYSAFLVATSADENSGKTTMLNTVSFLVPRPFNAVEATGPSIYRFVDREKPTFVLDEADDIFKPKHDIKHIFNSSWTRGTKIPRQVKINGAYLTVWFDTFCPKAIGLLGLNMPRTLVSRSIIIKAWPKRPEHKQEFNNVDDDVFAELRRKLARWSADHAVALKDAKPLYPPNFINRPAAIGGCCLASPNSPPANGRSRRARRLNASRARRGSQASVCNCWRRCRKCSSAEPRSLRRRSSHSLRPISAVSG
jgi:hypothetical protein